MSFEASFAIVVGTEGGYVNDPQDPGGETKYGVSKRSYPNLDIANLTLADAHTIYRRDFWDVTGCDGLSPPLALLAFDAAINNGPGRARSWLAAARRVGRAVDPAEFLALRMAFMAALPGWQRYGLGWSRRLCRLPFEAMTMTDDVSRETPAPPTSVEPAWPPVLPPVPIQPVPPEISADDLNDAELARIHKEAW